MIGYSFPICSRFISEKNKTAFYFTNVLFKHFGCLADSHLTVHCVRSRATTMAAIGWKLQLVQASNSVLDIIIIVTHLPKLQFQNLTEGY